MKRIIQYKIDELNTERTISEYLRDLGYTRKVISKLKESPNEISLNGNQAFSNASLEIGDIFKITIVEDESSVNIEAENLPLKILYEDEDILVVDKPAGMAIHPSINHHYGTLANAVMGYYKRQGKDYVFRCMNRLDKETSGVSILAKHFVSGSILSKQMKEDGFYKEYRVIVCGELPDEGSICLPIGRKEGSIIERCIDEEYGQEAITHFWRLSRHGKYSCGKVVLETGRTHQIRLHMKAIGYPLPGDYLYNPDFSEIGRQPLHCYRMRFEHPITKESMEFVSELPDDMKRLLED